MRIKLYAVLCTHITQFLRYFCYDRVFGSNGATCTPATAASIAEFRDAHAACFKYAFDRGIVRISITPHIDDGNGLGGWRQTIVFDPIAKYGGFSYNDVRMCWRRVCRWCITSYMCRCLCGRW